MTNHIDMDKEDQLVQDFVMIKFDRNELAMVSNILDRFLNQNDEVYKSCGVTTEKLETILNNLHARLDTTYWENFDESTILEKMWGISLDKARYDE